MFFFVHEERLEAISDHGQAQSGIDMLRRTDSTDSDRGKLWKPFR
jgi:hypothetical protein